MTAETRTAPAPAPDHLRTAADRYLVPGTAAIATVLAAAMLAVPHLGLPQRLLTVAGTVVLAVIALTALTRAIRLGRPEDPEAVESAAFFHSLRDSSAWTGEVALTPPHKMLDHGGADAADAPTAVDLRADLAAAGRQIAALQAQATLAVERHPDLAQVFTDIPGVQKPPAFRGAAKKGRRKTR